MTLLHQAAQKAVEAQIEDDGGPEAFARQAPFRALATQWLRDEFGSVEADNVGKEEFLRYVRLAERGALVGAALQQQPEPVAAGCPNYPGANVSTCIRDNLRPDCPLCGDVPPALQEVPREPVAEAARVLAEFAKTAPGRLPQRVQDAIALTASPSTTQQPSVDHALNTTPVVDHATQQQEAGSCDIVTLGGGIPGDPSGELTAICKGLVSAVAYGEHREVSALFDAPEQAHAFVRYLQRFVGNGVAASPSTTRQQEVGSGWKPIESAPKDGTWIAAIGHLGKDTPDTLKWKDGEWWNGYDTYVYEPTHWMPLPAAPSTPENADGGPHG